MHHNLIYENSTTEMWDPREQHYCVCMQSLLVETNKQNNGRAGSVGDTLSKSTMKTEKLILLF